MAVTAGEITLIAIVGGIGAIIAEVGGIIMVARNVRTKERVAAKQEIDQLIGLLNEARDERIEADLRAYEYAALLAQMGIHVEGFPTGE